MKLAVCFKEKLITNYKKNIHVSNMLANEFRTCMMEETSWKLSVR